MRDLTKKQIKLIDEWLKEYNEKTYSLSQIEFSVNTRTRTYAKQSVDMDKFPLDLFKRLEEINDTDILWNTIDLYIQEQQSKPIVVIDRDGFSKALGLEEGSDSDDSVYEEESDIEYESESEDELEGEQISTIIAKDGYYKLE